MIILAFDSTAKIASAALSDGERLISLYNIECGLTQSELLLPMIEDMLKRAKLSFSDVDLIATSVGPGSFTGVRIGAALLKGIAFGRDIPTVGVSTLEALAENARGLSGIIVAAMDARRGQFYNAIFRADAGEISRLTEDRATSGEDILGELLQYNEPIYVIGDGYEPLSRILSGKGLRLALTPQLLRGESAYSVAALAKREYESGRYTTDLLLQPTYLRLPQAERERLEREKQNQK